jgi:hypothetical protein
MPIADAELDYVRNLCYSNELPQNLLKRWAVLTIMQTV